MAFEPDAALIYGVVTAASGGSCGAAAMSWPRSSGRAASTRSTRSPRTR